MKRMLAGALLAATASTLLACGSDASEAGREGVISATPDRLPGGSKSHGGSQWVNVVYFHLSAGRDTISGAQTEPPTALAATCYGEYPDLAVEVRGPGGARLKSTYGEEAARLQFDGYDESEVQLIDKKSKDSIVKWGQNAVIFDGDVVAPQQWVDNPADGLTPTDLSLGFQVDCPS
uniref:hypothetical protein n=1 Tax=Rhodococcus erythropolis TaxID=1833 RepID=UPI000BB3BB59|nr:hypothetical protein [Rhodococcus erythropolis]